MTTKQIIFTEPYKAELLDTEYLPPKENEVTVSLEYSAISAGTEKANYIGLRNGYDIAEDAPAKFPRTVGYSAAGVVTEINCDVLGDSVIMKTEVNGDASLEKKFASSVVLDFRRIYRKNLEII